MTSEQNSCVLIDREDRILKYLTNALSEEEKDAFEAHYFSCEQCWRDVQEGLEIRAGFQHRARAGAIAPSRPTARRIPWPWIGIAAAVILGIAIWRVTASRSTTPEIAPAVATASNSPNVVAVSPSPTIPVAARSTATPTPTGSANTDADLNLRSASGSLRPTARREPNGDIRIEWPAVAGATTYRITVFAADGREVLNRVLSDPTVTVEAKAFADRPPNETLIGRVDAVNALKVTVASSRPFTLPPAKEPSR